MTTRNRTLRSLPEGEQYRLRALVELYAEYGGEIAGFSREELSRKFNVSPVTIDALKASHTINNR